MCVDSKNKIKSVLISETLINSYININNDKFVSVNAFRKYNDMKEDIKNTENAAEYTVWKILYKTMETYCVGCKKNAAIQVSEEVNKID